MSSLKIAIMIILVESALLGLGGLLALGWYLRRHGGWSCLAAKGRERNPDLLARSLIRAHQILLAPYQKLYLEQVLPKAGGLPIWAGGDDYRVALGILRRAGALLAAGEPVAKVGEMLAACANSLGLAFGQIFQIPVEEFPEAILAESAPAQALPVEQAITLSAEDLEDDTIIEEAADQMVRRF